MLQIVFEQEEDNLVGSQNKSQICKLLSLLTFHGGRQDRSLLVLPH